LKWNEAAKRTKEMAASANLCRWSRSGSIPAMIR
jgi:hypothetical protein